MKNGIINILVVVDMQNDFVHENGSLASPDTMKIIPQVRDLISNGPWDVVICTRDTHYGNYHDTLEGKKLPVEHCIVGTWGHEIHDDIKEELDSNYQKFDKTTFGHLGFANNDIPYALDMQNDIVVPSETRGGELEFHICGVCTSICVLANAVILRAKYPDAKIIVHSEACADVTPEAHKAALLVLQSQQCDIVP